MIVHKCDQCGKTAPPRHGNVADTEPVGWIVFHKQAGYDPVVAVCSWECVEAYAKNNQAADSKESAA